MTYETELADARVDEPELDAKEQALRARDRRGELSSFRGSITLFAPAKRREDSVLVQRAVCNECEASWSIEEFTANQWRCPGCGWPCFYGTVSRPCNFCPRISLWWRRGNQLDPLCRCDESEDQKKAMARRDRSERVERMAHQKKVNLVHAMLGCYHAQFKMFQCCNHPKRDHEFCKVCPVMTTLGGKDLVLKADG